MARFEGPGEHEGDCAGDSFNHKPGARSCLHQEEGEGCFPPQAQGELQASTPLSLHSPSPQDDPPGMSGRGSYLEQLRCEVCCHTPIIEL